MSGNCHLSPFLAQRASPALRARMVRRERVERTDLTEN